MIHVGDCLDVLRTLADNSVDAIVTDPPYGLAFMGKRWDYDVPSVDVWAECLRVLKPGGHLLAFAGTRTQHRMACRIEDAGFEIRDLIAWVYGSGFPKSLDVSKALDKISGRAGESVKEIKRTLRAAHESSGMTLAQLNQACGFEASGYLRDSSTWAAVLPTSDKWAVMRDTLHIDRSMDAIFESAEREVIGKAAWSNSAAHFVPGADHAERVNLDITAPATDAARQWEGWGTALKPALEPITVARKPLAGTVAANVLAHGTGALNIDGCRIETPENLNGGTYSGAAAKETSEGWRMANARREFVQPAGRWPANVIHDGSDEVLAAFPQAMGQQGRARTDGEPQGNAVLGALRHVTTHPEPRGDTGSAARFFKQCEAQPCESLSPAPIAALPSSLQSVVGGFVQSGAATWPSLAGTLSSDAPAASIPVTPSESRAIAETVIAAMATIGSECSPESQHERRTPCGSHARTAATRAPTGITTITTSLCKSDGSAGRATFTITPTSLDRGEAVSRFNYCAKASKADREDGNVHPTVKPTDLMRYLCRLVTPPGGLVLDPFAGSGSTGKGAILEGFRFLGIERDPEYAAIAQARIDHAHAQRLEDEAERAAATAQADLFGELIA